MKKRVFAGVLLCLAVMQLAVQYPAPVISQDVSVDSTVSVTTVTATADLASLSQRDGMAVLIKTGDNAGLWRYSKTSTATVDDTTVLNGPGSVGRFLQITIGAGAASLDGLHALTGKTAPDLDPDSTIEFLYYDVNEGTSYKVPLDELRKKGDVSTVSNVAALFTATHARDNQLFQTLGYSTEGIGANFYRYDASSTATIDGGFVQPGIGGTLSFSGTTFNGTAGTGRFIAVDQSEANIEMFGAVAGSNSTQAVKLACVTAMTNSIQVTIPAKTFPLTGWTALTLTGDLVIKGMHKTKSILDGPDGVDFVNVPINTDVAIESVNISGFNTGFVLANGTHDTFSFVDCDLSFVVTLINEANINQVTNIDSFLMTDCHVHDCGYGVIVRAVVMGPTMISGNYIHDIEGATSNAGIWTGNTNTTSTTGAVVLSNNTIESISNTNTSPAFGIANFCEGSTIHGNRVRDVFNTVSTPSVSAETYGIYSKGGKDRVTDNELTDAGQDTYIAIKPTISGDKHRSVVSNNVCVMDTAEDSVWAIDLGRENTLATGNQISGGFILGIYSGNVRQVVSDNVVDIEGVLSTSEIRDGRSACILALDSENTVIIGNSLRYNAPAMTVYTAIGVQVLAANTNNVGTVVANNAIRDVIYNTNVKGYGIEATNSGATVAKCSITGNNIRDVLYPVVIRSGVGAVVLDNICSNCSQPHIKNQGTDCIISHTDSGTPEASYAASIGSRFYRTDGGTSTVMYIKESLTGNTGWVAK